MTARGLWPRAGGLGLSGSPYTASPCGHVPQETCLLHGKDRPKRGASVGFRHPRTGGWFPFPRQIGTPSPWENHFRIEIREGPAAGGAPATSPRPWNRRGHGGGKQHPTSARSPGRDAGREAQWPRVREGSSARPPFRRARAHGLPAGSGEPLSGPASPGCVTRVTGAPGRACPGGETPSSEGTPPPAWAAPPLARSIVSFGGAHPARGWSPCGEGHPPACRGRAWRPLGRLRHVRPQ